MSGDIHTLITALLISGGAGYLLAWLCLLLKRTRTGFVLAVAAWLVNVALFFLNWRLAGEPPFGNMYHVQVFLALCFLPTFVVISLRLGLSRAGVYFAFVSAIPLIGALFMERDVLWRRIPALQSAWFVPHVTAYMISYCLAGVAFVLTIVGILRGQLGKGDTDTFYGEAGYHTLRIGFPFMTFGLLSGALWAEEAWGVYWSWDAKETWALITWTLYLVYFHCRRSPSLRRYADVAQLAAFLALLTTYLLVNLLPKLASALHSYA